MESRKRGEEGVETGILYERKRELGQGSSAMDLDTTVSFPCPRRTLSRLSTPSYRFQREG